MTALGPRADGLRVIRIVLTAVCVGIVALSCATVLLFLSNAARVQQINDERAANVRRACEDVNRRHDETIRQLRLLVDAMPEGPRKTRARQSMAGTVALIDALAPRRDCSALVREQVDTK